MCGKAIIPILVGVKIYIMALVLAPINEVKDALVHIRFNIVHRYPECYITWQIAQTLMRRRILLIWVYDVC